MAALKKNWREPAPLVVKLFRWTAPLIEVLFQVDYHRPTPVLHEPGGRQPAGHCSSAQDSPRRLQVRVLQSCWFFKLVFVPRVPYSVPGVFTLCTIFGRKPGFQVGYQWATTHVPDTGLLLVGSGCTCMSGFRIFILFDKNLKTSPKYQYRYIYSPKT